jgi:periplasmic protein CpxP/Spy
VDDERLFTLDDTRASDTDISICKENLMKTILPVLVASTLFVGGAYAQSVALSDTASPASPSHATMKSDANHSAEVERHIKDLHAKLKITPAEESQWDAVAQTMRDNAAELDGAVSKRDAIGNRATAIEDLNAYGDIAQVHAENIKKLSTAFAALYDAMPDNQKKVADEVFTQNGHEGKKVATKMKSAD